MDVLLDSNIYLQDLKLEGNQFTELFTYLRRTGSRILLPHLVREEVLARCRYKLWDATRKLESARENLSKLKITAGPYWGSIDFDHELKLVDERMHSPSKGVQVVDIDEYSAVDVKEVVMRGVQRKRPANESGEELRDVILWLLALNLAQTSRSGMIFISNDNGFKAKDGCLHPDLKQEVALLKQPLEYYAEIRECVVANALSQKILDFEEFSFLIPLRKLEQLSLGLILKSETRMGRVIAADIREFDFEEGINYTVEQSANFIEARFHGSAVITVEEFVELSGVASYPINISGPTYISGIGSTSLAPDNLIPEYPLIASLNPVASFSSGSFPFNYANTRTYFASPVSRRHSCSFRIGFSARIQGGVLESIEPEGIKFISFLPDETQPKNPNSVE